MTLLTIESDRSALQGRIDDFLSRSPYGGHIGSLEKEELEWVQSSAKQFVYLIAFRLSATDDISKRNRSIAHSSAVFSRLWSVASCIEGAAVRSRTPFSSLLNQPTAELGKFDFGPLKDDIKHSSILALSDKLAEAFVRGVVCLRRAYQSGHDDRVRHHTCLLGDIIEEMQDLSISIDIEYDLKMQKAA